MYTTTDGAATRRELQLDYARRATAAGFCDPEPNPCDEYLWIKNLVLNAPDFPEPEQIGGTPERTNTPASSVGMLSAKGFNDYMDDAATLPDDIPLWHDLWLEDELCLLFADTNAGKSIYAVQIAEEIAKTRNVLYFDFEMNLRSLRRRYCSTESGESYRFNKRFKRAVLDVNAIVNDYDFEDQLIENILQLARANDTRVLIIDNLTWLCINSEKGDAAGYLMRKLQQIKEQNGLSILVLAHTVKRDFTEPLNQNHLAGSKRIINFADSAFAIGVAQTDQSVRYIKQIKVRGSEFRLTRDNVELNHIVQTDSFTHFEPFGFDREDALLKRKRSSLDHDELQQKVVALSAEGKSQRTIASELGVSLGMVNKMLNR